MSTADFIVHFSSISLEEYYNAFGAVLRDDSLAFGTFRSMFFPWWWTRFRCREVGVLITSNWTAQALFARLRAFIYRLWVLSSTDSGVEPLIEGDLDLNPHWQIVLVEIGCVATGCWKFGLRVLLGGGYPGGLWVD